MSTVEEKLAEHKKLEELTLEKFGMFIHLVFNGNATPGGPRALMDGLGFMSTLIKRYGVAPAYEREKKWEYMLTSTGGTEQDVYEAFKEYGEQGWELVCAVPHQTREYWWKRAKFV